MGGRSPTCNWPRTCGMRRRGARRRRSCSTAAVPTIRRSSSGCAVWPRASCAAARPRPSWPTIRAGGWCARGPTAMCTHFRRCGSGSGSMSSCERRRTAGALASRWSGRCSHWWPIAPARLPPNCTVMNSGSRRMCTSKARKAWRCISSTARWTFSRRTRRRSSRRSSSRSPTC